MYGVWFKWIASQATVTEEELEAIKTVPGIEILSVKPHKQRFWTVLTGISAWKDKPKQIGGVGEVNWLKRLFRRRFVYVGYGREVIVDGYHETGSVTLKPGDTLDVDWQTQYKWNSETNMIEAFDRFAKKTGEFTLGEVIRSEKTLSIKFSMFMEPVAKDLLDTMATNEIVGYIEDERGCDVEVKQRPSAMLHGEPVYAPPITFTKGPHDTIREDSDGE